MRLAIAEKGLQCVEYDVSLPLSEHNEPWFMHLNPTGEVPVLVHNDNVICDLTQIMDYLEQNFNDGETKPKSVWQLRTIALFFLVLLCFIFCWFFSHSPMILLKFSIFFWFALIHDSFVPVTLKRREHLVSMDLFKLMKTGVF